MAETIKGLTIEFNADTSKFKEGLKDFNKELKYTEKDLKTLQNSLKLEFDNTKFTKAQEQAKNAIKETEKAVQTLKDRLKLMEETGITDKNVNEFRNLQNELIKTEDKAKILENQLKQINQIKVDQTAKGFNDLGNNLTKAGQTLAPISAAAGATLVGLGALGLKAVKTADDIATSAQQLGMTAEKFQELQYIAMQTDVPIEKLQKSFVALRGTIGEALIGTTNASTKALESLGFTMEDLKNNSSEEMFDKTIRALSSIEDSTMQVTMANQLFGEKVANEMVPLLKTGESGLKALKDEFQAVGFMSNDQVEKLAEFDNTMNKLKETFKQIGLDIGTAFLPVMQTIADILLNNVAPALQKVADWFSGLDDGTKKVITGILALVASLAPMLLIAGKISTSIGGMIPMFTKLQGAMSGMLGPVGIILGILALLYASNEKFRDTINKLISTLMSALMPIIKQLGAIFTQLLDILMPIIIMIGDVLAEALLKLMPFISKLLELLMPLIQNVFSALMPILTLIAKLVTNVLNALMPLISIVIDLLVPVLGLLMPIIEKIIKNFVSMTNIVVKVIEWLSKLYSTIFDKVLGAFEFLTKKLKTVWDFLKGILGLDDKEINIDANVNYNDTGINPNIPSPVSSSLEAQNAMKGTISNNASTISGYNTTNYNNSTRNIEVNLTVHNYGAEIDEKELVTRINLELAKNM